MKNKNVPTMKEIAEDMVDKYNLRWGSDALAKFSTYDEAKNALSEVINKVVDEDEQTSKWMCYNILDDLDKEMRKIVLPRVRAYFKKTSNPSLSCAVNK